MPTFIHIYMYACLHIGMYPHLYIHSRIHTYIRIYICICMYMQEHEIEIALKDAEVSIYRRVDGAPLVSFFYKYMYIYI